MVAAVDLAKVQILPIITISLSEKRTAPFLIKGGAFHPLSFVGREMICKRRNGEQ